MSAHDEVTPPDTAMAPEVAIAGAGPSGLMLACELALAGIRTVVLEPLSAPSDEPQSSELPGQIVRMLDVTRSQRVAQRSSDFRIAQYRHDDRQYRTDAPSPCGTPRHSMFRSPHQLRASFVSRP